MRHLISLGRACDVAFQLRMHGAENVPHVFDWLGTPTEGLIKIFESDFDVFHPDDLALIDNRPNRHVRDRVTGVVFFHHFPMINGHTTSDYLLFYANFIKVFNFQVRRFRDYVKTMPVTLVRRDITEADAHRLEEVFFSRYPGADAQFLYLVHNEATFRTGHGHARFIPRTSASLGEPADWIRILGEEGLIGAPYRHATAEILGAGNADHSLSPDDRFSEQQLLDAIAGNPEHPMFPLELSRHYRKRNRYDEAELQALRSVALAPDSPASMFELLMSRWRGGKADATTAADALIELTRKGQVTGLLRETAACLLEAGRLEEAIAFSGRAIMQDPVDHNAYYTRAMSLYRAKDVVAAERALSTAITLSDRRILYHHMHSRFLDELDRLDDALAAEQRAIQLGGGLSSLVHLGGLLNRLGRKQEAIEAWQKALPMAGKHAESIQNSIDAVSAETAAVIPINRAARV
jgi:tetratricopeptide (TPR) repeat protein